MHNQNLCLRRPCNLKLINFTLLLYASVFNFCDKKKTPMFFWEFIETLPYIQLDYAGQNLNSDKTYSINNDLSITAGENLLNFAWPSLSEEGGIPCLKSIINPYYSSESGFRFSLCNPALEGAKIQSVLKEILKANPTAYPAYEISEFSIRVMLPSEIIKTHGEIQFSLDGSAVNILRSKKLTGKQIQYSYGYESHSPDRFSIFRKFPRIYCHALLTETAVLFLYEIPGDKKRFMVISSKSQEIHRSSLQAFQKISQINAALIQKSLNVSGGHAAFKVSEIYFGKQGGAGSEFIEIANNNSEPSIQEAEIILDDTFEIKKQILLFPGSVFLFTGSDNESFRLKKHIVFSSSGSTPETYSFTDYAGAGLSRMRTANRESAELAASSKMYLHPSLHCKNGSIPCGSEGIHPDLLGKYFKSSSYLDAEKNGGLQKCTVHDFKLSEINPFGLYTKIAPDSSINPYGKFIEMASEISCRNESVIFISDFTALDTGIRNQTKNEIILFAADRSFFKNTDVFENPLLKSIRPESPLLACDLRNGEEKTLKKQLPSHHEFIYGAKYSPHMKKVHSLVNDDGNYDFHSGLTSGLRPDLESMHQMSPGNTNPPGNLFSEFLISEIYPAGSYDSSNKSVPGDEFIEFIKSNDGGPSSEASIILEIKDPITDKKKIYQFPKPDRFSIFSINGDFPLCFYYSDSIFVMPGFTLWNSPSTYTLYDRKGNILDRLNIDQNIYSTLDGKSRKSLIRIFPGNATTVSNIEFSPVCGNINSASPGSFNHYSPFLSLIHEDENTISYRLYSENIAENIHHVFGRDLLNPQTSGTIAAVHGDLLSFSPDAALSGNRILFTADIPGVPEIYYGEFFIPGPLLLFQTISPTPAAGESEWIRLCSPRGFTASDSASGLYIKDSNSADKIIPYLNRFSTMPPGYSLNGASLTLAPGACAVLIDPDFDPAAGQILPLVPNDTSLWTIESSSAIGNGLASGENLIVYRMESDSSISPLCTYGRPDTASPFSVRTVTGERVERVTNTIKDLKTNYYAVQ